MKKEIKEEQEKEPGLEERFAAIEDILTQMEGQDVTLDQAFELYKQGMEQVKLANASLDTIEKEMIVVQEEDFS
ncbi:MAG: exodeoxyribonuclease VII small subunit [Lachnospiraceae bacterium]|nr:exodeoxyribonuclease VII small subunit [Lachnospiraceae bacterium]